MSYQKAHVPSVHFPQFQEQLPDLSGKIIAITGTTSGTGKVAAHTFAKKGAKVLMLNRPSNRATTAYEEITAAYPTAEIIAVDCDLQSFESVQQAADKIKEICPNGLYALVNNAGIMAMPDEATSAGFDVQMHTNHLSHFLLTRELYPLLQMWAKEHGDARIVNHSSIARLSVPKLEAKYLERNGGNLGGNGASMILGGARWTRYGQTKLANAAFTAALHHKLQACNSKVKALVAHPGFANTELQVTTGKAGGMATWYGWFTKYISQSAEDGAMGIISCTALKEAQSGAFYGPGKSISAMKGLAKPFALEAKYDNEATRELLWSKSCEAIGKDFEI